MTTQEEFTSFLHADSKGGRGYGATSPEGATTKPNLPQAPKRGPAEPAPQAAAAFPPAGATKSGHGRSRSEMGWASDSHPLKNGGTSAGPAVPPSGHGSRNRPKLPSRSATGGSMVPQSVASPPTAGVTRANSSRRIHRRAKSDIPSASPKGGRTITKSDLLKNLPDPRWGGAKPLHSRKRTGSGGPFSDGSDTGSVGSGAGIYSGYGAIEKPHPLLNPAPVGVIGSVAIDSAAKKRGHGRSRSDMSLASVTTDMAKSALFKGVTEQGTIQLQLPKDSFRILMDSQLEAGSVYKRKLVDNEDHYFLEFHTMEDNVAGVASPEHENQKLLPPDLYVMAVDSTLYRRILDEVIESKAMPCGTFFCGHHEDVRHPDIKIAVTVVTGVFILLLVGTVTMKG